MKGDVFNRPGITDGFLAAAGCQHVGGDECARFYGFKAAGIVIPFRTVRGEPIADGKWPFARVRLYDVTDDQKYHQPRESGVHIYVPPGFADVPKSSTLILVEGEFKALALTEAGYAALGLCGITGAMRSQSNPDGGREYSLNEELADLLDFHRPARVVFLGDADVVFNSQFATEAAKLRKLVCGKRRFQFVEAVFTVKPPADGPKGIDDCREAQGDGFGQWFDKLIADGFAVPVRATASEIFCELVRRETKQLEKLLAAKGHEAKRARVRLLESAARLWNETGAKLDLQPLLCRVLGVKETKVAGLVRDAAGKKQQPESGDNREEKKGSAQGSVVELPDVEQWPNSVKGTEVLNETAATFAHYVLLPSGAADAMALWTTAAHAFEAFLHTPRLNLYSPEKGCGKTTALDVLASLTPRPLRTESITAAVLFRLVEAYKPTLLLDEVDAYLNEADELRGLLNAGHKRGAKAYRCEGESNAVRGFAAFAPAALAGIGALPGTLHDRSIVIKLVRAKPGEVAARFDSRRTEPETELCRKLARWTADNFAKLKSCDPQLPETAFNRLADNWRPLFAVAEIAGGDWPQRAADAFAKLTSKDDLDAQGIGARLLADIAATFAAARSDKLPSAKLAEALAAIEGKPWAEWGRDRKPISPNQLAIQLRPFGISPRTIKLPDGDTAKGYQREMFNEAFARYLPRSALSDRNPVTVPENVGDSALSETSPPQSGLRIENATSTNENELGDGVTIEKPGTADVVENALLL